MMYCKIHNVEGPCDECRRQREAKHPDMTTTDLINHLIDVGSGKIPHRFMGQCPDAVDGHDRRDKSCRACRILIQAEAEPGVEIWWWGDEPLPANVARCDGVGSDDPEEGWREGCETCLRRTAPRSEHVAMIEPPPIIAFECEYLIEPKRGPAAASESGSGNLVKKSQSTPRARSLLSR